MRQFVKPRAGVKVRRETLPGHVAPEGETVEMTAYYRRRIADGDLLKAKPQKKPQGGKD